MPNHRRSAQSGTQPRQAKIPEPAVPGNLAERRWKLLQQESRYHWKFLDDEDLLKIAGKRDELLNVLHEKYSYTRTRASKELSTALAAKKTAKRRKT